MTVKTLRNRTIFPIKIKHNKITKFVEVFYSRYRLANPNPILPKPLSQDERNHIPITVSKKIQSRDWRRALCLRQSPGARLLGHSKGRKMFLAQRRQLETRSSGQNPSDPTDY